MTARFSQWVALAVAPSKLAELASDSHVAIVQVKVLGRLLDYPTGKSAMVWYGRDAGFDPRSLQAWSPSDTLVARWLVVDDADAALSPLLARFIARFGRAPILNT